MLRQVETEKSKIIEEVKKYIPMELLKLKVGIDPSDTSSDSIIDHYLYKALTTIENMVGYDIVAKRKILYTYDLPDRIFLDFFVEAIYSIGFLNLGTPGDPGTPPVYVSMINDPIKLDYRFISPNGIDSYLYCNESYIAKPTTDRAFEISYDVRQLGENEIGGIFPILEELYLEYYNNNGLCTSCKSGDLVKALRPFMITSKDSIEVKSCYDNPVVINRGDF